MERDDPLCNYLASLKKAKDAGNLEERDYAFAVEHVLRNPSSILAPPQPATPKRRGPKAGGVQTCSKCGMQRKGGCGCNPNPFLSPPKNVPNNTNVTTPFVAQGTNPYQFPIPQDSLAQFNAQLYNANVRQNNHFNNQLNMIPPSPFAPQNQMLAYVNSLAAAFPGAIQPVIPVARPPINFSNVYSAPNPAPPVQNHIAIRPIIEPRNVQPFASRVQEVPDPQPLHQAPQRSLALQETTVEVNEIDLTHNDIDYATTDDYEALLQLDNTIIRVSEQVAADPNCLATFVQTDDKQAESEDARSCTICYEEFKLGDACALLSCLHKFHYGCLSKWRATNPTCPVCRFSIPYEVMRWNYK